MGQVCYKLTKNNNQTILNQLFMLFSRQTLFFLQNFWCNIKQCKVQNCLELYFVQCDLLQCSVVVFLGQLCAVKIETEYWCEETTEMEQLLLCTAMNFKLKLCVLHFTALQFTAVHLISLHLPLLYFTGLTWKKKLHCTAQNCTNFTINSIVLN